MVKRKSTKIIKRTSLIPGPDEYIEPSDKFLDYWTLIHGTTGIGKTSFLASAPGFVIAQFEPRRRNIRARQVEFRPVTPMQLDSGMEDPYDKFVTFMEEAEADESVEGIGIDNIVECYKIFEAHHLKEEGLEEVPKKDFGFVRGQINRLFENFFNNLKYESRLKFMFTCHTAEKEGDFNTGTTESVYSPAVPKAVMDYIKKAMDFVLYFGYNDNNRAIHCRWDSIMTKCGNKDHFLSIKGKPLNAFKIPEDPSKWYPRLEEAWANKIKVGIYQEAESGS